ncbi:MAG: phosphoribosylanthranilate isomerase [Chitinispirillales bacterium]|nr:phosphoribosylanthranilate isomerase [Chitinispirillales bacterium]
MRTRIKICGITRVEDALAAVNLGVDALGFIFAPASPRYITPIDAAKIIKELPPFVSKVGVFVNEDLGLAIDSSRTAGVDVVQLHGDEPPEYCAGLPMPIIKVFSVGADFDTSIMKRYDVAGYLLDTWDPKRRGGSGNTFDWSIAAKACGMHDTVILSGGLGPSNLREAVETVRPYAVDLNSGVEVSPGVKDHDKIKAAVSIVKGE